MTILEQKSRLRSEMRTRLQALPATIREQASAQACALLQAQNAWQKARSVFFYSPLPNELNIWALMPEALKLGKTVLLPRFNPNTNAYVACRIQNIETDLLSGKFGINEPGADCPEFPLNQLDLTLVPGIAFDATGARLGRGRGYYDRLLAEAAGIKCGVAFDEQLAHSIPVEPHDIHLECILTPTRWLAIRRVVIE
jgi:5-formyltetrahydrofolate cyclo-ligase